MVQEIYEVQVTRPDLPRGARHQVPADNAQHAKAIMRDTYYEEGVAFTRMTARKVW
jgi:hypothetical protein